MHRFLLGDVLHGVAALDDVSVDAVVTSPPYWGLRDYSPGQLGAGPLHEYLRDLADVFDAVRPKLTAGALVWVNLGDTAVGSGGAGGDYGKGGSRAGRSKYRQAKATVERVTDRDWRGNEPRREVVVRELAPGQWAQVPARFAAEMQDRGWLLRADVIWVKDSPQRHDVAHVRRPKEQHEHVLMFSLVEAGATRFESTDQKLGDVWAISAARGVDAVGKAPWPVALPFKALRLSGKPGVVLDPFVGAGNTYHAATRLGWSCVGIDCDPAAAEHVRRRFRLDAEPVGEAVAS